MKHIPMLDLSVQYNELRDDMLETIDSVLKSSRYILGDYVKEFEAEIAKGSNVAHGIGVGNGSDAIHIALQAAGIKEGDEVITVPFTFFATAGSIVRAGATPVFIDIDPATFNIDPTKIAAAITKKTKAIIPVHLYGQMADMTPIMDIAKKYNLVVIEDAAQAIGAMYNNQKPGELGTAATYSFFPTKNLGAYGDGGMIVTSSEEIAENSRIIRVHGSKPKYYHHTLGYNSRLDELQAAILSIKHKKLAEYNKKRRSIAKNYSEQLGELKNTITTPAEKKGNYHVYHQYTLRVKERDKLQAYLKENGIASMIYYPVPLHLQPVFSDLGYKEGSLPVTEKATEEVLSLPIYPELTADDQAYIIETIKTFYQGR